MASGAKLACPGARCSNLKRFQACMSQCCLLVYLANSSSFSNHHDVNLRARIARTP